MNEFTKQYAPPSYIDTNGDFAIGTDTELVEWVQDNNTKGQTYLRANRAWKSADICMAIFYGDEVDRNIPGLSKVSVKKLRRQAKEQVANASNIRPRWKHKSRKDRFAEQAKMQDQLRDDWFYTQFIDQKIKAALQNAAGGGTGYLFLWPEYNTSSGQVEINTRVLNWRQVLPFHAGDDAEIDNLFGITIHLELPVPEAHEKFPKHIGIIKADRNIPGFFARGYKRVRTAFKGVVNWKRNKSGQVNQDPYPVADIFYTWVKDNSINTTGKDILMGEPKSHYSYLVPSLYDEEGNPKEGVTFEQCKLFPYKRLIISTAHGIIYDGPPYYICQNYPVIQFTFEKVVGEFLGINIIRDGRRLEESANNILRSFEDAINGRLSPPIAIDTGVPKQIRNQLSHNPRTLTGKVFQYSGIALQKAITPLISHEYYNIDQRGVDIIRLLFDMIDSQMGAADVASMARLKQMPSADTQEMFTQLLGALATDYSRGIEQSLLKMANIWLWFSFQVYTTERVILLLGADSVVGTVDFDPNSLVPKWEDYPELDPSGANSYAERLHKHIRQFSIFAAPNSLQERMSQTNKLILMQLLKMGVPISNRRLYDSFIDDGQYTTEKSAWEKEQLDKIMLAAKLQTELKKANEQADPMNRIAKGVEQIIQGDNNEGRPATNRNPPRLSQRTRDGVPDSTIETN